MAQAARKLIPEIVIFELTWHPAMTHPLPS
jgi:hypothetical protein